MPADYLIRRGAFWIFFRRTPAEYADVERRQFVAKSTKVRVADDPDRHRARQIADKLNTALEAYWRDLVAGQAAGARQRLREAQARARRLGFDYQPVQELVAGPLGEILRRIETLEARGLIPPVPTEESKLAIAALLGTAQEAKVMVSGLFEEYQTFMRAKIQTMARERLRIWTNAHKAAAANFLEVLGTDKPLAALTRSDAAAFRRWWSDRVVDEGLKKSSANVQIDYLAVMIDRISTQYDLDLPPIFHKLKLPNDDSDQRKPFAIEWLRDRLLKPGAFDGLNAEARRAVYVMIETGLRPSEICGLDAGSIMLDHAVPHVAIAPNAHRGLKTKTSRRQMPLVGVALKAMQAQPKGFPRYAGKAPSMSAAVNQFMRGNDLMPTEEHTLYSLRHSFKDRLRALDPPDELIDELMGHSNGKPRYGDGRGLVQKRDWLQRIALPVSSTLTV